MATRHQGQESVSVAYHGVPKVPAVRPYFWAVKLLTTAMGEAMSDFVVLDVNKYLGVVLGFLVFVAAIMWQFRTPRYRTWPYWTAVSMVAVFGTMAADVMHVVLGMPYLVSAGCYAICLIVTFAAWYRSEGTLDIHSIVTRRREVFYWLAVIFTFAMGTALGDLFAMTFTLGYLPAAFVFTALICVPLVAWRLGASPVLTFWTAYILTRPIGASFADFFGMPKDVSGAGFGHGAVSLVALVLVLAFIVFLYRSGIDRPEAAAAPPAAAAAVPAGYGQPGQGNPQYGQPPYGRPQYAQARYGDPGYSQPPYGQHGQHGQPQYADPRYGAHHYGRPQYDQPQYDRPQYDQPQYGRPSYGQAQDGGPRQRPPWDDQAPYGRPQYSEPRYSRPQYADPRQGSPRREGPGDGGRQDRRSP